MEKLSTLLIFFLFFFMNGQGQDTSAEISTKIYAIGPKSTYTGYTGTYTKLSDAISAISSAPINGNLIFEFQPDYIPSVETFPINLTSSIASNSAATITFRPAYRVNSVINFSSNGTVINNTGADYIIFDGRNGGTGDHKYFQFTSSSATAPVISLSGDALYNQILYSVLKGSNNTVTTGCILMINAPTTGNNFYTVDHCNFNASGSANNALYSSGIASNGTITNNNFFDFRNGAGINLANGSDNAVIDNNNFYQTAAYAGFTGTTSGILVAGGNNVRISNNNIGGSGPGLTGTWTVSSTIPATYNFTGINATSLATTSIIYNNRIQSFDWKSNVSTWTGINVSGSVNVGSNGANYVGNDTVNNIKITYYLAGKAKVAGIIASGAAIIENNNIGSITTILNGVTETGSSFTGINSSGTGRINHNTIGSSTVPNSINTAFQSSSNNLQNVYGIYSSGSTAFITNNTIANITNNSSVATGHTRGILVSNSATSININSNDIHSISTSQPVISKADTASLDGINIQLASLANVIIAGNTIYDLVNTTNAAISINGILYNSSSVKSNRIEKNYIHSFKTFSNTATQNGINIILGAANIQNNVVRLGIDKEGSSITSTAQINGILKAGTYATNFYFNTVYIGGENVTAGSIKTCALNLYAKSGSVEESYNNLFINMRTHAVANKLNYAVIWPSIAAMAWASDYNIYNVSRTDGILGNVNNLDVSSLKTLQESFTGADLHSGFGDPLLVNPTGALTTLDLHPATATEAESTGILIKDITDDITGTIRSTSTPTDIGAYSGNFTQVAPSLDIFSPGISYNNLGNGSTTDYRLTYNFASITDIISGINVSPGTKPRLYYKSSSNANTFVGNTSADNGWKWVEALGSTSPFDFKIDYSLLYGPISKGSTIQYFVVAQNQAATPAVSFSPSAGASGTSVAPTEMKAPSTPNSFTIVSLIPASINVGTGQPYTTLTGQNGVFAALNAGVINSNTVVTITSDISEPGTNSLNQVNEEGPNGGALTITIQSEGNRHVISGAEIGNRYPLISINGAKRLTINGGVGKLLTFRNTNSSPANTGPVFQFDNSSQDDLLTNCIIESNLTSNNYGAVRIHSSGINNVTINQNDIRDARAGTIGSPIIGIYSSSTNNTVNIKNNNIYNLINPNSYGIYLNQVANGCSVTGNSIYMENGKAASGSFTGIMIGSAGNHIVSGNYIGGSAPNCGGSVPLTVSGPGKFTGISSYYTSTPEVIIQGNTIQNISMTNTGAAVFYGINNNSGPIIITGNTIGSPATTNSIQLAGTGSSAGIIQSLSAVINPCTIEKNIVANINLTNGSGNQTFSALLTTGGTVRMNTIYNIGSTVASSNPVIYGINNTDGITSNEFSNNVISLNSGAATTPTLYGFYEFSGKGTTGFYYNSINLYGAASGSTNSYTFNRTGRGTYISNNNVLINARTGGTGIHYAIYSIPDSGFTSDYNDLFVSGTTLGHWGSVGSTNNKTDLEAWRGSSNQDANSISVNPLFTSTTNLVPPIDSPIIGVGTPLQSVTTDLSGVLRNLSAPTLGAYELACTGPTTGGIIAGDQTIGDSSLPSLITSSSSASGYSGRLEYKWQKAISPFTTWDDISTSNASTYQPESLTQTTQFKRLARNTCMAAGWAGAAESNRVTITININSWRGTSSKDWNDPGNWAQNRVPGIDENIAFDETSLNDCQLNNDLSVNNITNNQSSYRLNTNGKTLTIKGKLDITKAPLIEASTPNSTILFSGSASQTIPLGAFVNDRVYNLSINNPHNVILNGSLNLLNSITTTSGQLDASTNAPAIIYSGTNMQSINSSTFIKNKVYDLIVDNSSGVSLASDLSIDHTLTVNSGKQLIIPAGTLLNVDGIIKNADASGLVIQASPTGDAPNGSLIFHNASSPESFVPATVEMYTKANRIAGSYKWQFFGIPLKSIQANPTFAGSYVREMHEDVTGTTGHWVQLQNESVLTSFTGYEITQETSKIIRFKGNLENADYGPVKLSYTSEATYAGQHLIGNPYLAAITIKNTVTPSNALIFGDGMDKTVYLYNTGSYADWSSNEFSNGDNSAPGQYLAIPQNNAGSSLLPASIPSMQAFLVMVNAPGETATISIPYSSTGTVVKNTTQQRAPTSDLISTRIDVKGSMFGDSMWIFTVPTCTRGYDNGWDGYKIMGSSLAPQLYAMESDGDYQVNSVDDINNTYLGFRAGIDTIYTLTFTHQNRDTRYQHLYLTDLSANITVEITATGTQYRFNSNLGTSLEKRFKLIATADAIDIPTENKSADARVHSLTVFSSQNIIFVNNRSNLKGSLYIYDITGRMIQKMQFEAHVITTLPVHLPGGSYLSRAVTMSEEATTKLAIQAH